MKSKKDIILVVVTVIMVIVLIVGFIYDRNIFTLFISSDDLSYLYRA